MAKTLSIGDAARVLGKTSETLRQWRRDKIGPPYVIEGKKPVYRADLLKAGDYTPEMAGQKLDRFPPVRVKVQVRDGEGLSAAEEALIAEWVNKLPVQAEWEVGDKLVMLSTMEGIDLDNPSLQSVLDEAASKIVKG